jgi:Fe-S-cluster containining protein
LLAPSAGAYAPDANRFVCGIASLRGQVTTRDGDAQILEQVSSALRGILRIHEIVFYRRYAGRVGTSSENNLIHIVDAALAQAVSRSGAWLACRPGCCQCCIGAFPISQSDAMRLREGLLELERTDPDRAARVLQRARDTDVSLFPGDISTGILYEDPESQELFESFANDEPCPALDRQTGTCDLYAWRPITCRTFGPALRLNSDSVDVCELCYDGATDEEILACQVEIEIDEPDASGQTIVAFALR